MVVSFATIAQSNKVVILIDDFNIGDSTFVEGRTFIKGTDGRLIPTEPVTLWDERSCDTCVYSSSYIETMFAMRDSVMNARYEEFKILLREFGNLSLEVHKDTLYIRGSEGLIIQTE